MLLFLEPQQITINLACMFAAHHEKSVVPASFKVPIDHVFDYIESGKRKYRFGKKSGKSLEFWIPKSALLQMVRCSRGAFFFSENAKTDL